LEKMNNLDLLRLLHQCTHKMCKAQKYGGQGRLLILLKEKGTLTQRELIEITGRRSATLSEQLDSMDKAGYIIREKNEADRRNVDVTLTPLGQETAKDAEIARTELADQLFTVLTEQEKQQLSALLEKLSNAWEALPGQKEE